MDKIQLLILAFVYIPHTIIQAAYPPTTQKRKFTFLSQETTWNDAASYCSSIGASLLEHSSHATTEMISKYSSSEWSSDWGNDYWLGLYIQDMNIPEYRWDGSCSVAQTNSFNHFEGGPPSTGDLDSTKKCATAKKDTFEWRFEKCSINYVAICQLIIGPCTYEKGTTSGACTELSDTSLVTTVTDRNQCEQQCTHINADNNGECWAVTYIESSKKCVPSISRKPYDFDDGKSKYSSVCSTTGITSQGSDSFVSWKRCFQAPGKYTSSIPSSSSSSSDNPSEHCLPVVTTTTTTTTTTPKPTTTTTTTPATTTTTTTPATTTTTTTPATTTTTTTPTTTTTTTAAPTTTTPTPTTTTTTPTTTTPTPTTTTTTPTTTTTALTTTTTSQTSTTASQPTLTTSLQTSAAAQTTTQTSTTSSSSLSTNTSPTTNVVTSSGPCSCRCTIIANLTLEAKIEALKRELTVDKKTTSSHIRKYISAPDERVSAKSVGMILGAGVLICVFGLIVFADLVSLVQYISGNKASSSTL